MSECVYLEMTIHKNDISKPEVQQFLDDHVRGRDDPDGHEAGYFEIESASPRHRALLEGSSPWQFRVPRNYGLTDARKKLADAGVRFHGQHGSSGAFPAFDFIANGVEMWEWPMDDHGGWSVSVIEGNIDGDSMTGLQTYLKERKLVVHAIELSWKGAAPGSSGYLVDWKIDMEDVANASEAATRALIVQRDPESAATVFEVTDKATGEVTTIDLSEEDADAET
jgi:hypothetical protein